MAQSLPPPMLASASDDEISVWEPHGPSGNATVTFAPHTEPVTCLRWTSNDRILASGSRDGSVALSEASGALFHTLEASSPSGATVAILALTWSPGSRYLAAAGSDAVVRIFDLQKRSQALVLRGHRAAVRGVAWSPSEVYVASSSDAGEVVVHRVQGSVSKVAKVEHPPSIRDGDGGSPPALGALQWAPFHPSLLAVGASDGSVAVWSIRPSAEADLPPQHVFCDHTGACTGLQWSPVNQHLLASCSSDSSLLFYDVTKRRIVRTIRLHRPLTAMAFASSGVHLAAGTAGGELLVFDLRLDTEQPSWSLQGHHGAVRSLAFQRSAAAAATAGLLGASPSPTTRAPASSAIPTAASRHQPPTIPSHGGVAQCQMDARSQPSSSSSCTPSSATASCERSGQADLTGSERTPSAASDSSETPASRRAKPRTLPPSPPRSSSLPPMPTFANVDDDQGEEESSFTPRHDAHRFGAYDGDAAEADGNGGSADGGFPSRSATGGARTRVAYEEEEEEDADNDDGHGVEETEEEEEEKLMAEYVDEDDDYADEVEDGAFDEEDGEDAEDEASHVADGFDEVEGTIGMNEQEVSGYAAQHQRLSAAAASERISASGMATLQGGDFGSADLHRGEDGNVCRGTSYAEQAAPTTHGGLRPRSADAAVAAGSPRQRSQYLLGASPLASAENESKPPTMRPSSATCLPPSLHDGSSRRAGAPAAATDSVAAGGAGSQQQPHEYLPPQPRAVWAEAPGSVELKNRPSPSRTSLDASSFLNSQSRVVDANAGLDSQAMLQLEGMFFDLRRTFQEDMRNLHLDMIRELDDQRHEMRELLRAERREISELREENARLAAENRQLRGPMGGLRSLPPEMNGN